MAIRIKLHHKNFEGEAIQHTQKSKALLFQNKPLFENRFTARCIMFNLQHY